MMTERQRKFREQYRADISPLYNGLLHITVMYGAGIAAIWYCVSRMHGADWEWLVAVPALALTRFDPCLLIGIDPSKSAWHAGG